VKRLERDDHQTWRPQPALALLLEPGQSTRLFPRAVGAKWLGSLLFAVVPESGHWQGGFGRADARIFGPRPAALVPSNGMNAQVPKGSLVSCRSAAQCGSPLVFIGPLNSDGLHGIATTPDDGLCVEHRPEAVS
jgi:hypothetical protein